MSDSVRPSLVVWAALLGIATGIALHWPGLHAGFHSDDYQQLAMLEGRYLLARPFWDLFWFGPRTPEELSRLIEFGFDPWWTAPGHRIAMLRPLASALFALDHRLFGSAGLPYHLHSLAWWAVLVVAVARLLAELLPGKTAALAVLLFALHVAHAVPVAWLANRSALIATCLGVLALAAHVRAWSAPERVRVGQAALSAGLLALALAAGEYALCVLPYFAAHALLGARLTPGRRWLSAAPALGLGAIYLGVRSALGYGVRESGLYLGLADGARLLYELPARCAVMAADLLLGIPALWYQSNTPLRAFVLERQLIGPQLFHALPDWKSVHALLGALALLAGIALVRALARRAPTPSALPFLALGSLLALLPAAAALPSTRLLVAPAVGATALLAAAIMYGLSLAARRRALWALCAAALAVHLGLAPFRTHAASASLAQQAQSGLRWARGAQIPRAAGATDIAIVSASDFATATNLPWLRLHLGLPLPRSYRRLSGANQAHRLHVVDGHSFDLFVLSNDVCDAFAGSVYRSRAQPLVAGHRVRLRGMQVEVLATSDGNPNALRFSFDAALDDPRLLLLHAAPDGLRRLVLPPPGQSLLLPRASVPWEASP